LREDRDHINFLRAAPLMAHNFGDLDRVMIQWGMNEEDSFCKKIFKLGHQLNDSYSNILVYTGKVNQEFSSKENHRHMSMRQPKCIRKSYKFLIPIGPFMDQWGEDLGKSSILSVEEKAEIIAAFYEGYTRQDQAYGYCRAFGSLINSSGASFENLEEYENYLPYDLVREIKKSPFTEIASRPREEFEGQYASDLSNFVCPETNLQF
jgi:hypothetical protein